MTRRVARRYPYATSFYIDADTKNACKELAKFNSQQNKCRDNV